MALGQVPSKKTLSTGGAKYKHHSKTNDSNKKEGEEEIDTSVSLLEAQLKRDDSDIKMGFIRYLESHTKLGWLLNIHPVFYYT